VLPSTAVECHLHKKYEALPWYAAEAQTYLLQSASTCLGRSWKQRMQPPPVHNLPAHTIKKPKRANPKPSCF
jgi:hypothetical protein